MTNDIIPFYVLKDNEELEIGHAEIDEAGDAWVRIDSEKLSNLLGVEDIDGVAVLPTDRMNEYLQTPTEDGQELPNPIDDVPLPGDDI